MLVVSLWRWIITHRLSPVARNSNVFFSHAIVVVAHTTKGWIVLVLALYAGSLWLDMGAALRLWTRSVATILLLFQMGFWGNALLANWIERYSTQNGETNAAGVGTARLITFLGRVVLYSVITLLILDNVPGVQITPLLASLGVGGIAVALAVQNILGDLFASLSIALDKPFIVGDFITVGNEMGTVQEIGLKTTRLRSLSGEQLVLSNGDLLNSRIRNFKRMEERRILFNVGVLYETDTALLRVIPQMLREAVEAQAEQVRFDRAHLARFDSSALTFEVVYFVLSPDFNVYMDIQHAINMLIVERFRAEGIVFAYPTQQIYLNGSLELSRPGR
ncbi:MAG: mechanosensitive ion channel family protein [Candidatus Viridilinea halotolerans]|uniref:Mechanosensitive ion channel family protein n=1 Tax=Candidatus Viridilinea halotolerans TaxID=2491704 RepID=A0A426TYH3_9CHLR|nr:MAG: mechanosensitive ion channel family protein [Candidatus Viridilinea halotolerans]